MPSQFVTAFGTTVKASHTKQIIEAWHGVSGSGVPLNLVTVNSASAYAAKIKNQGAGGALLVQSSAGATLLNVTDSGVAGLSFDAGVVGAPALSLGGDGTTGWYRPNANEWGWSDQGVRKAHWKAGQFEFSERVTVTLGTLTDTQAFLDGTATWNDALETFTALQFTVTDTNSAAASLLLDLKAGASPATVFSVRKDGRTTVAGGGIIVTGNSTITGTLDGLTGLTITGNLAFDTLTLGTDLVMTAAASQIVPGATSFAVRNNADLADNLLITDAGIVTTRSNLFVAPTTGTTPLIHLAVGDTDTGLHQATDGELRIYANGVSMVQVNQNGANQNVRVLGILGIGSNDPTGAENPCLFLGNVGVAMATNPTLGGYLYVQAGALLYRGSSGTVTALANA